MRGEYSRSTRFAFFKPGSPPLARGVRQLASAQNVYRRITPACAGSTRWLDFKRRKRKDHPRLRGEYRREYSSSEFLLGSPPLARGVLNTIPTIARSGRITPACAGSTLFVDNSFAANRDHPRLRGEYLPQQEVLCVVSGSPPLARGVQEPRT